MVLFQPHPPVETRLPVAGLGSQHLLPDPNASSSVSFCLISGIFLYLKSLVFYPTGSSGRAEGLGTVTNFSLSSLNTNFISVPICLI